MSGLPGRRERRQLCDDRLGRRLCRYEAWRLYVWQDSERRLSTRIDLVNRAENHLRSGEYLSGGSHCTAARHRFCPVLRGALLRHMPGGAILDFRSNKAVRAFVNGRISPATARLTGHARPCDMDQGKTVDPDVDADVGRADGYAAAYARYFKSLTAPRPEIDDTRPALVWRLSRGAACMVSGRRRRPPRLRGSRRTAIDVITLAEKIGRFACVGGGYI